MKREIRVPKQKRSIEKKNKIIEAAYKLFNENGYHNINTAQIAKEAGLSTGCLYDYFVDKQDIFMDVLKVYNEKMAQFIHSQLSNLPEDMDLLDLMKQFIHIFLEAHQHSKGFHQEVIALSYANNSISSLTTSYEKQETLTAFATYLKKHGVLLENKNEKVLLMLNTLDTLSHELLYQDHPLIDPDDYIDECAHMLKALLIN
ncbi:MAG: TetR/AcrR family transcriptional regulator [Cellulosilyticum sp.]|nr:TetR/AcrR family transcriptional regulator [Cellulosilyticum sp.]